MRHQTLLKHLKTLVNTIGERPTGSISNRKAMEYIGQELENFGYPVMYQFFDCKDWKLLHVSCRVDEHDLRVSVNPYSPACRVSGRTVAVSSLEDFRDSDLSGKVAVLSGDLSKEPLMPKNFEFYQPETHQEIIRLLEEKEPLAVVFVAPGDCVVPVIVDGDFLIPSITVGSDTGGVISKDPSSIIDLTIDTTTEKTRAANVITQTGGYSGKKIVICAHFDTKFYTPGALDNATGVTALLLLAERFKGVPPGIPVEFVFFNGEECYSIPGEMTYFSTCPDCLSDTILAVNVDGIGMNGHSSSIAYFTCPTGIQDAAEEARQRYPVIERVDPWPQGDHMIFSLKGIPAIAISTKAEWSAIEAVIHTEADTMDGVDIVKILQTVDAVEAMVRGIAKVLQEG